MAAPGSAKHPPSENESGVTFTTPMTSGRTDIQVTGSVKSSPGNAVTCGNRPNGDSRRSAPLDEAHRLFAGGDAGPEQAPHRRRDRGGTGLLDASHGHAQVL